MRKSQTPDTRGADGVLIDERHRLRCVHVLRSRDADNTIGNSREISLGKLLRLQDSAARRQVARADDEAPGLRHASPRTDRGVLIVVKMVSCEPILKSFQSN
jgi:hypothetical protein